MDIIYIIGGRCSLTGDYNQTYEVITIDLNTGEVSEAEDVLHAVYRAGCASSFNRLVICGGMQESGVVRYCQLYSPSSNRYARLALYTSFKLENTIYTYTFTCFTYDVLVLAYTSSSVTRLSRLSIQF